MTTNLKTELETTSETVYKHLTKALLQIMVTNLYRIINKNGIVVINVTELRLTYPSLFLHINEPTKFQYSFQVISYKKKYHHSCNNINGQ